MFIVLWIGAIVWMVLTAVLAQVWGWGSLATWIVPYFAAVALCYSIVAWYKEQRRWTMFAFWLAAMLALVAALGFAQAI